MSLKPNTESTTDVRSGYRIAWFSMALNLFLGTAKCIIGIQAHSKALLGDGYHSFLDLSSDVATLLGLKMASKPQDADHHYGHRKFASLSTLFIAGMLLTFCALLIYGSIKGLFLGGGPLPGMPALIAAGVSIIVKEGIYGWTRLIAHRIKSRLLMASAWHHRTDSFTSVLVLVAVGASIWGGPSWLFLDKVMGLFMGLYLGLQGLKLARQACEDLLDTAPHKEMINDLLEHILPTPGVVAYHNFRVRRIGDMFEVDLHLQVDPDQTVEQGHTIAAQVKKNILDQHADVIDVLIHIEPASAGYLQEKGIAVRCADLPDSQLRHKCREENLLKKQPR